MAFPLVKDLLPAFAGELEAVLARIARPELAEQIGQLHVVDRCRCGGNRSGVVLMLAS